MLISLTQSMVAVIDRSKRTLQLQQQFGSLGKSGGGNISYLESLSELRQGEGVVTVGLGLGGSLLEGSGLLPALQIRVVQKNKIRQLIYTHENTSINEPNYTLFRNVNAKSKESQDKDKECKTKLIIVLYTHLSSLGAGQHLLLLRSHELGVLLLCEAGHYSQFRLVSLVS